MINPSGSKYLYSYDGKQQLKFSISTDGQEYGFTYDDKGNVTKAEISARKPAASVQSGGEYILVNAYSGLAIGSGTSGIEKEAAKTYNYNPASKIQHFKLESVSGKSGVYYFKAVNYADRYFTVKNSSSSAGEGIWMCKKDNSTAQQFKLVKQSDGTFGIFTGTTSFNMCLDPYIDSWEIKTGAYIKQNNCEKDKLMGSQKWYFMPVEESYDRSVVTQSSYTASKNFIASSTDERGNVTEYFYNETKGLLNSTSNANGVETQYTYDANNDALLSVSSGGVTNHYSYSNDLLQSINVNDHLQYKFAYDHFGKTTANYVGNGTDWRTLSTIQYNDAGLMTKQTYGNGDYIEFSYDSLDRQTQTRYNGNNSQRVTCSYGNNGSVAQITDYYTNTNTRFVYDLADRVVSQREYTGTAMSGGALRSYTDFTYASKTNYLTGIRHYSPLGTQNIGYRYGTISKGEMPDQIYGVTWNGAEKVSYTYDPLGRLTNRKIGSFNNAYTYEDVGTDKTTTLVKSVSTPAGTYSYTYDNIGNILSITDGTYTSSYEYDSLNQLVRANDERAGKTYTYSYSNGNITEMKEYAYTTGELGEAVDTQTWQYGDGVWSDLVTQFNGYTITYDEIGNPVSVDDRELSWRGRQLTQITDGENEISYAYNGDGQRASKTVNGEKTEYIYNGDILAGQKTGNTVLVFMYDNNGDAFGFIYNGTEYYYIKNAQNDVTAIASADGTVIANYYYDSWGKLAEITGDTEIAELNPIRYRSYYYDSETEWYYLNTRYYSPDLCRFMSSDNLVITVGGNVMGYNLFAYCFNNPINLTDNDGNWPQWVKKAANFVYNKIVKPVTKLASKLFSKINSTYSTGYNVSATVGGFSFNAQIGVSVDTKENVAIQYSYGGGVTGGSTGISVTRYKSRTNAPDIYQLEGPSQQIGGSYGVPIYGVPIYAGGDLIFTRNEKLNENYFGYSKNIGFGASGGEMHVEWGKTQTFSGAEFNVYDLIDEFFIKIMEE